MDKKITKGELAVFGVSLGMVARVGDKTFHAAVSPLDFSVFKKSFYRDRLHAELVAQIEASLDNEGTEDHPDVTEPRS